MSIIIVFFSEVSSNVNILLSSVDSSSMSILPFLEDSNDVSFCYLQ